MELIVADEIPHLDLCSHFRNQKVVPRVLELCACAGTAVGRGWLPGSRISGAGQKHKRIGIQNWDKHQEIVHHKHAYILKSVYLP